MVHQTKQNKNKNENKTNKLDYKHYVLVAISCHTAGKTRSFSMSSSLIEKKI